MGAPTGTVTFLFTDIEGSTRLWEMSSEAMAAALAWHDEIVRRVFSDRDGHVFATGGDGFAVAFSRAQDAVMAAIEAQRELGQVAWPPNAPLKVRMGLHSGSAEERGGDYFGPVLNRTARLMAVAHGGQVLCSEATAALLGSSAEVVLRSLGEHRLRDLGAPEVVFQIGDGQFPALRSLDAVPTNLPTIRTEIIGRSDDITAIAALLGEQRLVTLTGVGGVGKTRLGLAVAASVAPGYADGCWLVDLAAIADGRDVAKTVGAVLGTPVTEVDRLAGYLSERRLLLVLDNCEHVVGDTADLVDAVLTEAPEVRVLTTTREPLGVEGERVWRVASLPVADPEGEFIAIAASPAIELFAARAGASDREFAVTAHNIDSISAICRHLDGIPLAIELAAARCRAMPPAEIEARLGERFRLLSGGSHRAQERHRTLLATVGWSYELLSGGEKAVFRRLAVFPASFDLAAAEAIAGDDAGDVVECVLRLVDRSLVQYEPQTGRYRLLETLRQYAGDRLLDSGETDDARSRHGEYFAAFVDSLGPALLDGRYASASLRALTEFENLRALADWCVDGGRWSLLAQVCLRLHMFILSVAPVAAGWYRAVVEHGDAIDPQTLVDVTGYFAFLSVNDLGDSETGAGLAERSITVADAHHLQHSPWAWFALCHVVVWTTRGTESRYSCARALDLAESRNDEFMAICAQATLAYLDADQRAASTSVTDALVAIRRAEQTGHPVFIATAAVIAASIYISSSLPSDYIACLNVLNRIHGLTASDDQATISIWLELHFAAAYAGLHDSRAVTHAAHAYHLSDRQGAPHAQDWALRLLAVAAADAGSVVDAATLVGYTETKLRQYRILNSNHAWITTTLEELLGSVQDRSAYETAGAAMSRRDIISTVERLSSTHPPSVDVRAD